jgi:pimeloyl-ACP methyl ester carboxylesterase
MTGVGLPALLLLSVAEMWQSRMVAISLILLWTASFVALVAVFGKRRRFFRLSGLLARVGALFLVVAAVTTPNGRSAPDAAFQSIWPGKASFKRLSPANLVPEVDQVLLGTYLAPQLDRHIDVRQAERLRQLFLPRYQAMRQDPDFAATGSVMNYVYRDFVGAGHDTGHLFVYIPESTESADAPIPAVVFLHGAMGNFKVYAWMWKAFAEANGCAVVCPSFGIGFWPLDGGAATAEAARQYCLDHPRIDGDRLLLAGLSNGGLGIAEASSANSGGYRGVVFISPVMSAVDETFCKAWSGRPVLVIHGDKDRRIPLSHVTTRVKSLRRAGVRVKMKIYTGEDHFLLLSSDERMLGDIAYFVAQNGLFE